MPCSVVLLAHQGGWDEILLVVAPMLVIVALLRLAKRRVEQVERSQHADAGADVGTDEPVGGSDDQHPSRG